MTNINLYQGSSEELENDKKESIIGGGFFFSVGLLVFIFLSLAGLKFAVSRMTERNNALAADIANEKKDFDGDTEMNNIIDFQSRLDKIKKNLDQELNMKTVLSSVAKELVSGVSLSSYTYNEGRISMQAEADSFQVIARQMLNLKKSTNFVGANIASIKRGDKKIEFNIEMQIKK